MIDKVQKIREEVEKIANSINPFLPDEDGKNSDYEAGRFAMATQILQIIDSLEESVRRTSADIESAMQEVEEKSKAFTEAHKGESADEILAQMRGEGPISDDLKKAAGNYAFTMSGEDEVLKYDAFIEGAQWQKEQDQSIIELAEDHAMFAGMEKMKEQMMKEAVDGIVYSQRKDMAIVRSNVFFPTDLKKGDKVKLIIIKEEQL